MYLEGHHNKFVIASNVGSWKAAGLGDVHTWTESFLHHNVINLIVGFPIWTVPRDFFWMFCGSQKYWPPSDHCSWQIPGAWGLSHLIWCCSDAHTCLSSSHRHLLQSWHASLLVPQGKFIIFLGCFIQDFLQFFIKDLYVLITVSWCWSVRLNDGDVEWLSPQSDGDEPIWDWATVYDAVYGVLVDKEPNTLLMYVVLATPE